jgi:hypothetical protein
MFNPMLEAWHQAMWTLCYQMRWSLQTTFPHLLMILLMLLLHPTHLHQWHLIFNLVVW